MKWFKLCSFCNHVDKHDINCLWRKILRAAKWSENGLAVVFSGKKVTNEA